MKIMKKAFAMFVAVFTLLATLCMVPVSAATTVAAQLYGRIEDNGQAIYKMVLDYGNVKVSGVDKDTYTVHAKTTTEGKRPADEKAYGDYDQDRTIVRVEEKGTKVEIYFDENEVLMYGVPPLFVLNAQEKQRVLRVLDDLLAEEQEEKFLLYNMNIYLAMQLHALYCRYAMERKKKEDSEKDCVWDVIQRVLLDTSKTVPMEEYAKAAGMTTVTLNRKIVRRCGYTFFQLQKMGKIFNACALLHFPDLNIQYISDYLGFTNIEDFYRVFKRYMNVSVREYQKQNVGNGMQMHSEEEALQILVYLILNFHDPFQMKEMEKVLKKNAHLLERRAREVFGRSVLELLEEVRIQISCSYLVATDRTVTQISSDVGFGSISSFQRSFFKYMNQTPSQFRCSMKSK